MPTTALGERRRRKQGRRKQGRRSGWKRRRLRPHDTDIVFVKRRRSELDVPPPILDGAEGARYLLDVYGLPEREDAEPEVNFLFAIGVPGTGKSWFVRVFFSALLWLYPGITPENTLCLCVRSVTEVIDAIEEDGGEHQNVLADVEDAVDFQDSRESMSKLTRVMSKQTFRIRHLKSVQQGKWQGGKIIIAFTAQVPLEKRLMTLATSVQLLSHPEVKAERALAYEKLGYDKVQRDPRLVNALLRRTRRHASREQRVLLQSVGWARGGRRFFADFWHYRRAAERHGHLWPEPPPPEEGLATQREVEEWRAEKALAREVMEIHGADDKLKKGIFYSRLAELLLSSDRGMVSEPAVVRTWYYYLDLSRRELAEPQDEVCVTGSTRGAVGLGLKVRRSRASTTAALRALFAEPVLRARDPEAQVPLLEALGRDDVNRRSVLALEGRGILVSRCRGVLGVRLDDSWSQRTRVSLETVQAYLAQLGFHQEIRDHHLVWSPSRRRLFVPLLHVAEALPQVVDGPEKTDLSPGREGE